MQHVAVKGKNPAVHRQEFYSLSQCPNEPLQQYVAKLQAKATHCNFSTTCECTKTVSYAEAMVMDQMLIGLHDKDIQGEVLAKDSQLKTFNDQYDYIHAFEEGKHTSATLGSSHPSPMPTSTVAASRSQYQWKKRSALLQKFPQFPPRPLVGALAVVTLLMAEAPTAPELNTAHTGKQSVMHATKGATPKQFAGQSQQQPKPLHLPTMHWPIQKIPSFEPIAPHCSTWDSQISPPSVITLMVACPTWEWCSDEGCFKPRSPKKPQTLPLCVSVLGEAHTAVGYPIPASNPQRPDSCTIDFLADTGAQTCVTDTSAM